MSYKFNVFTGQFDLVDDVSESSLDVDKILLDQDGNILHNQEFNLITEE